MDLIDWLHRVLGIREAFLCFASYHSDNVETIIGDDGSPSENLALRASSCFLFMFGGSAYRGAFSRNRQVPKRPTLPEGLLLCKGCLLSDSSHIIPALSEGVPFIPYVHLGV